MFTLKLKGNPKTTRTNELKLRLNGKTTTVTSYEPLEYILEKYETEDIEILIEGKYRKAWNLYYKQFNDSYSCEGIE